MRDRHRAAKVYLDAIPAEPTGNPKARQASAWLAHNGPESDHAGRNCLPGNRFVLPEPDETTHRPEETSRPTSEETGDRSKGHNQADLDETGPDEAAGD
jgi:hypothetical protein